MPAKTVGGFGHVGDETRVVDVAVLTAAHGLCAGEELQEVSAELRPNPRQVRKSRRLSRTWTIATGPRAVGFTIVLGGRVVTMQMTT